MADYEGHMSLPEIAQAQMIADHFEALLREHAPPSLAFIGCAGGNGFDRIDPAVTTRVVGVDINPAYIAATRSRHAERLPGLELYSGDIQYPAVSFDPVDFIYAALVLEYCQVAQTLGRLTLQLAPGGVLSLLLQLPCPDLAPFSPSPFSSLELLMPSHRLKSPAEVQAAAESLGLRLISSDRLALPSSKHFLSLSFRQPAGSPRSHRPAARKSSRGV
ncbi:MAG: class I SAM-dependent methyltransferase [Thermaerobacter sp.]|nr:class I SAM-dependent methyltransferase [Thermaerobacter sp.]